MAFFKRSNYDERADNSAGLAPLAVLFIILILVVLNLITHLPLYLESLLIPVKHPLIYKFPKYDQLLHQIVQGDYVDYSLMQKSKLLDEAVSDLSRVSSDELEDDDQKLCYWINSYNLLVLKAISEKYPIIRVDKQLTRMDFNKYFVGGKSLSLKTIHDQILAPPLFKHPLAIFVVCNGTLGSPPLLNHVIEPKTLESDADEAAHKFVAKRENVLYDLDHKTLALSPFFHWNELLFRKWGGPEEFANKYLPPGRQLDLNGRFVLFKTFARHFNWYLNDVALQHAPEQKAGEQSSKADESLSKASEVWSKTNDSTTKSTQSGETTPISEEAAPKADQSATRGKSTKPAHAKPPVK